MGTALELLVPRSLTWARNAAIRESIARPPCNGLPLNFFFLSSSFPRGFFHRSPLLFSAFYGLVYLLALVSFSLFFLFLLHDFYCMAVRATGKAAAVAAGSLCDTYGGGCNGTGKGGIDIGGAMKRRVFCSHGQLRSLAIKRARS